MSLAVATDKVGEVGILVLVRRLQREEVSAVTTINDKLPKRCPFFKMVWDPCDFSSPSATPSSLGPSPHVPPPHHTSHLNEKENRIMRPRIHRVSAPR